MITYFVDDKLGGVTSLNYNLMANKGDSKTPQQVISIDLEESEMTRSGIEFPVDKTTPFRFSIKDNYYTSINRLSKLINRMEEGALVLNYDTEMAMLDHYPTKQTTYQLVHDDYNVGLAKKYGHLVDVFICHNRDICAKLQSVFPARTDRIFYRPHGVPIPELIIEKRIKKEVVKLLFLGRMIESKGIFDLLEINNLLRHNQIKFEWTCIGNGPQLDSLKQKWNPADKVNFASPSTNREVINLCKESDIFVLPTKFEGSPVSLLETMSVGLVPVITKLPGGITEIVNSDIGFALSMDDNAAFAEAITKLARDRSLLHQLSSNCIEKIRNEFDVKITAIGYHQLFERYREFYQEKEPKKIKVGARLDHPLIPSVLTKFVRTNFS